MKTVVALSILVLLLLTAPAVPPVAAQQSCLIERVTYRVEGLQLSSWIMKPAREGRFPVVVWLHGAKAATPAEILAPIITESSPCHPWVASSGWMILFTQTRGYGGSEGPNPAQMAQTFFRGPVAFLQRRADDANTSVEWLRTRSDVNPACIASTGHSHGGATALLASGTKPALYRATVATSPVVWAGDANASMGMEDLIRAGMKIPTPILIQSNTTDIVTWVELNRILARELQRWERAIEYKEYTHPSGHPLFNIVLRPELFQIWGADTTRFLERAFAGCAR